MIPEAADAPAFDFVSVDREHILVASARVGDVVGTAADGIAVPGSDDVEMQRRMLDLRPPRHRYHSPTTNRWSVPIPSTPGSQSTPRNWDG